MGLHTSYFPLACHIVWENNRHFLPIFLSDLAEGAEGVVAIRSVMVLYQRNSRGPLGTGARLITDKQKGPAELDVKLYTHVGD